MKLATPEQVRALEAGYRDRLRLPLYALMEAAGGAVAARVLRERPERAVVVCGKGNNGGDGLVVARRLLDAGLEVEVRLLGTLADSQGDAALAARAFTASGGKALPRSAGRDLGAGRGAVVVDALFGSGFNRAPDRQSAAAFAQVALARRRGARVVAVDLPSGLSAETGANYGAHVSADVTVTFAPVKVGLLLDGALDAVGELEVAEIGIPQGPLAELGGAQLETVDLPALAASLGPRPRAGFKNTFGHVLALGGAEGKSGAIALTAMAALRAGAGLVTVASRPEVVRRAQAFGPELMGSPLEGEGPLSERDWPALQQALKGKQALVIGPGLEVGPGTRELVLRLLAVGLPTLLDADGLNALGVAPRLGDHVVITPHPGEAGRLLGRDSKAVQADRVGAALALAKQTGAVVALKGAHSLIAEEGRVRLNLGGSARLATAGSGDVLAGVVGALLARHRLPLADAAALGVALHARLGELDTERATLTAGDLVALLPRALAGAGL